MLITLVVCLTIINLLKDWKTDEGSCKCCYSYNLSNSLG